MLLYTKTNIAKIIISAYLDETQEVKKMIRDNVFEMYIEANGFDMPTTFKDIKDDIEWLKETENYEGCAMLHDILTDFE